jgi:ATP-dependent RNA helicase DDX23/PRP28
MGFEEQVLEVLDGMGSILKSENEDVAETQLNSQQSVRITAMFSATMSSEVERLAKTYLRHPVIVKIGDEETGKNKRIEQRVMFLSEGQKKNKLIEELNKLGSQEKVSSCFFVFIIVLFNMYLYLC